MKKKVSTMTTPQSFLIFLCVGIITIGAVPIDNENLELQERSELEDLTFAIFYAYNVDKESPNYLARGDLIFADDLQKHVSKYPRPEAEMDYEYSTSEHTRAEKVAYDMTTNARFSGAFSTAASMKTSESTNEHIKTVRMDAIMKSIRYGVSSTDYFRTHPEDFLTDNFKSTVKILKPEEIERKIGVFYATEFSLGGEIRRSYVLQASKYDTESRVTDELKARFGHGMFGMAGSISSGIERRSSNRNAKMRVSWAAQGGKTDIWLGVNFSENMDSLENITEKWADSINDENLYPSNFELQPLWKLVEKVDAKKGKDFKEYLEKKWEKAANDFHPTEYIETKVNYTVTITTDSGILDGTNSLTLKAELCGKYENDIGERCVEISNDLDNDAKNDFERGAKDTFKMFDLTDVGVIKSLTITATEGEDAWKPKKIKVKSTLNSKKLSENTFYNYAGSWISTDSDEGVASMKFNNN